MGDNTHPLRVLRIRSGGADHVHGQGARAYYTALPLARQACFYHLAAALETGTAYALVGADSADPPMPLLSPLLVLVALGLGEVVHAPRTNNPAVVTRKGMSCERTFRAIATREAQEAMVGRA
jgi:hypothetical protein